jgi:hypothetical protein
MGEPEMISLCKQHGDKLDDLTKMLVEIQKGLIGDAEMPGAITRIRMLENTVAGLTRALWIAGTTAIGFIVAALITKLV